MTLLHPPTVTRSLEEPPPRPKPRRSWRGKFADAFRGIKQSVSNSLVFTRIGTDLRVSIGFSYNALQNSFGFTFEIMPNLVPPSQHGPTASPLAAAPLGGIGR